ncbi:MAG: hypothetical protein HRT88_14420 [Lentisphaeraceae bacterium]|nr:hypothetical protein [Lentisphaeraceae bacterium]
MRHLSGEQLVNSLNSTEKVIRAKYDNQEALKKMYRTAVYKNKLVEKLFPTSLDDTEASYRGTLNQSLHLSTNQTFLNYTRKLAENSFYTYQDDGIDTFLKFIFNKFYTRNPTDNETAFFKAKLNFNKSYSESGAFETVWTLLNSPEMRLY